MKSPDKTKGSEDRGKFNIAMDLVHESVAALLSKNEAASIEVEINPAKITIESSENEGEKDIGIIMQKVRSTLKKLFFPNDINILHLGKSITISMTGKESFGVYLKTLDKDKCRIILDSPMFAKGQPVKIMHRRIKNGKLLAILTNCNIRPPSTSYLSMSPSPDVKQSRTSVGGIATAAELAGETVKVIEKGYYAILVGVQNQVGDIPKFASEEDYPQGDLKFVEEEIKKIIST